MERRIRASGMDLVVLRKLGRRHMFTNKCFRHKIFLKLVPHLTSSFFLPQILIIQSYFTPLGL